MSRDLFGFVGKARKQGRLPSSSPSGPRPWRFLPRVEQLESRYTPTCTFDPVTGVITGSGNDSVELKIDRVETDIYCGSSFLAHTALVHLSFNAGGGTNSLVVNDSAYGGGGNYFITDSAVMIPSFDYIAKFGSKYTVQNVGLITGAGNDTINIANPYNTLDFLPKITVDAGGGTNTINADDSGYGGGDTYSITDTQLILPNTLGVIVTYTNVQNFNLKTGAGNDTINITNGNGTLDNLPKITVDAGGGKNKLNVSDHYYPYGDVYQVDSFGPVSGDVQLPYSLGLIVSFTHIQTLTLYPSPGPSTVWDYHNPDDFTLIISYAPPPFLPSPHEPREGPGGSPAPPSQPAEREVGHAPVPLPAPTAVWAPSAVRSVDQVFAATVEEPLFWPVLDRL
jgi:hypothetical protein